MIRPPSKKDRLGLEDYLGTPKNKIYQENSGFFKPKFLGISYILKGSIINVGVTPLRCHFQHYFFAKK